jgi:hypothetical protein
MRRPNGRTSNSRSFDFSAGGASFIINNDSSRSTVLMSTGSTFVLVDSASATVTVAGVLIPSNGIKGVATNSSAASGIVGEEIILTMAGYTKYSTTNTFQCNDSITLTAGDWDIDALITFKGDGATLATDSLCTIGIGTTINSLTTCTEGINIAYIPNSAVSSHGFLTVSIAPYRVSLNTSDVFTLGQPRYLSRLRARRIR